MSTATTERCPHCGAAVSKDDQRCGSCHRGLDGAALLASSYLPPAHTPASGRSEPVRVSITDLDMPIGSMVVLLLKLAVASIPAAIVTGVVILGMIMVLIAIGAGMGLARM